MRIRVGLAEQRLHGQDRALVDSELGLFGVFDGIGEFKDSGQAAQLAADTIAAVCRGATRAPLAALVRGCEDANTAITRAEIMGSTTATVAWIIGQRLHYVSVGDSRLYLQKAAAPLVQVTWDEGEGHVLDNYVGHSYPRFRLPVCRQKGTRKLDPGDTCLLVTDGITGDYAPDLVTPEELAAAVAIDDPQQAADNVVQIARKHDDRTAVVIMMGGGMRGVTDVERLREELNQLNDLGGVDAIAERLAPWRVGSEASEARRCALAHYLQNALDLPSGVSANDQFASIDGAPEPLVPLPWLVAEYQRADARGQYPR